jgi:hypothetical protein
VPNCEWNSLSSNRSAGNILIEHIFMFRLLALYTFNEPIVLHRTTVFFPHLHWFLSIRPPSIHVYLNIEYKI